MSRSDKSDKVDRLDNDLDELKTTVDELASDPPHGAKSKTLDTLKSALEQAGDAADDLEEEQD